MKEHDRDCRILRHMISYCDQIAMAVERFGPSYDTFAADPIYRNAVSLCILQIGELVGNLSQEFRDDHPSIPWRQIKLMRNIVAHRYGTVDYELTWDVVEHDIPGLKSFCQEILDTEQHGDDK